MVNLWDYKDCNEVTVKATEGYTFTGKIAGVEAAEEYEDVYDNPEDMMTILLSTGELIGLFQSEVISIEEIKPEVIERDHRRVG